MHHGHNPDVFRFFHEDDGVGKITAQMPAGGRGKFPKPFRVGAGFLDEPFHFVVKTPAEFEGDVRIVLNGLHVFLVGFRMKEMRLAPLRGGAEASRRAGA